MKKTLCVIIALILSLSLLPASALAKATTGTEAADELYRLGLFRGTGTDALGQPVYDLDKPITRLQSVVMLIRLLGEEDAALACTDALPFADVPEWGRQYVAYAYCKGYTKGMSATVFSPELQCTSNMYLTLVLRSLGYNDSQGDFAYESASAKAAEVGVTSEGKYSDQSKTFYRDDCVLVSNAALTTPLKGGDEALISSLVKKGAVSYDALSGEEKLLVSDPPETPTSLTLPLQDGGELGYSAVFAAYPQAGFILDTPIDISSKNPLHKNDDLVKLTLQREYWTARTLGLENANIVDRAKILNEQSDRVIRPICDILVLDRNKNVIAHSPAVSTGSTQRTFSAKYISYQESIDELNSFAEEHTKQFGSYSFELTSSSTGEMTQDGKCFVKCTTGQDVSDIHIWDWLTVPVDATNELSLWDFVLSAFYFQDSYTTHEDGTAENYAFVYYLNNITADGIISVLPAPHNKPTDAFAYTSDGNVVGYVHLDPAIYNN